MRKRIIIASVVLIGIIGLVSGAVVAQGLVDATPPEVPVAEAPGSGGWLVTFFIVLIVLPFVPGLLEVALPWDRYPLQVDLQYTKDPRYMGRRARALLAGALEGLDLVPGRHEVTLSKPETLDLHDAFDMPDGECSELLTVVRGNASLGEAARLENDLHVDGDAAVGRRAVVRSLACGGRAEVGPDARVVRWLDAEGEIVVRPGARLGATVSTPRELHLGDGVTFRRLWGSPVLTDGGGETDPAPLPASTSVPHDPTGEINIDEHVTRHDGDLELDDLGSDPVRPLVVRGDFTLGGGLVFRASVKVYGSVRLRPGAVVVGDVFAEQDVVLEDGAVVEGNVFTQGRAELRRGARVGAPERRTSLVAHKELLLGPGVSLYGYTLTDGRGEVRCDGP